MEMTNNQAKVLRKIVFYLACVLGLLYSLNSLATPKKYTATMAISSSPVPVSVQVTATNVNYVETISVCNNTSGLTLPLSNIEFDFNYAVAMPSTSIWGTPWVAWKLASQKGLSVVLTGGTPYTPPLAPDPNCLHPLTIQFNTTPTNPPPTAPFVFKAEGVPQVETGQLTIGLLSSPAAGLPNPTVTVQGTNFSNQQTISWNGNWALTGLAPGIYTINASSVNSGSQYYYAPTVSAIVTANATALQTLHYVASASGNILVTLNYAPGTAEPITFSGQHYSITQPVISGQTISLPADIYTVTSNVPGYAATLTPSSLTVPTHSALNVTYARSSALNGIYVGNFDSNAQDSQTTDATKTNLANLPSFVTVVNLTFMRPDTAYIKSSLNYANTGLGFNYVNGSVLQKAIASLHQKNPLTKILVSIGGPNYLNWANLNMKAIADFVSDFGLDGVDINYQSTAPGCALGSDHLVRCSIDNNFQSYVTNIKNALKATAMLTVTGWSVGAYGQDSWTTAQPQNQNTGMMLPLLRSSAANAINMVNVMSYDAGSQYDPGNAFSAYTNYYSGQINMGVKVPPELITSHVYTLCNVLNLAETIVAKAKLPGMMIDSFQKTPIGTSGSNNPTAEMMSQVICSELDLFNCNQPLLINNVTRIAPLPLRLRCH